MAIKYAVKSGNWSDSTVWNSGTLPTSTDDVYPNTFTVTVDGNYTANMISNRATTGVSNGGTFYINSNNRTLTASLIYGTTTVATVGCVTITLQAGEVANIVASILGGNSSSGNSFGVRILGGFGTVNIVGTMYGGSNSQCHAVMNDSVATVNVTGNCYGGGYNNSYAVMNNTTGTCNITGNCYGTQSAFGGSGATAWPVAAYNNSIGIMNITGNLYSSTLNGFGPAVINASAGILDVVGSVFANVYNPAISNGIPTSITILSGPFLSATNSVQPINSPAWRWKYSPNGTYMSIYTHNLSATQNLYTSNFTSELYMPATANVRSGITYGPSNELTGTCAIPPAGSTLLGVPVDDETGTMPPLSSIAAEVWNVATANLTTSGTIGAYLKNAATVETVGDQVATLV